MPDDELIRALREILESPGTSGKALEAKASAARQLDRLTGGRPQGGVMAALVERRCGQSPELADAPPDPMRDLQAAAECRRAIDPVVWSWLPVCPENVGAAEREVLQAMRRLGLGPGPLDPPGVPGDELAPRRRRR